MKSVLHSTLETKIASSVIKSKEVLETFGTGAVANITVSYMVLLTMTTIVISI